MYTTHTIIVGFFVFLPIITAEGTENGKFVSFYADLSTLYLNLSKCQLLKVSCHSRAANLCAVSCGRWHANVSLPPPQAAGAALAYVGAYVIRSYDNFNSFIQDKYTMIPAAIIIIISIVMFVFGLLGCCATIRESKVGLGLVSAVTSFDFFHHAKWIFIISLVSCTQYVLDQAFFFVSSSLWLSCWSLRLRWPRWCLASSTRAWWVPVTRPLLLILTCRWDNKQ